MIELIYITFMYRYEWIHLTFYKASKENFRMSDLVNFIILLLKALLIHLELHTLFSNRNWNIKR